MPYNFLNTIFGEEKIEYKDRINTKDLPSLLRNAREMEKSSRLNSSTLFLKEAAMLAEYEDDYEFSGEPVRYYPTYQSFTNEELRGYFSWRTKIRKGIYAPAALSFKILYIYELINQIGIQDPQEGYDKLAALKDAYKSSSTPVDYYLDYWLRDYIVYYNLPPVLLDNFESILTSKMISYLYNINNESKDKIIEAISSLSGKWLTKSKFYLSHTEDMNIILYNAVKRMSAHYANNCKRNFVEQYFGSLGTQQIFLFNSAIFSNPLKRKFYSYQVHSQFSYKCKNGKWSVQRRFLDNKGMYKFRQLIKLIDNSMRLKFNFGHPIMSVISTKWIQAVINEEIDALIQSKKQKVECKPAFSLPPLDLSALEKIRKDADATRDKLATDDEIMDMDDENAEIESQTENSENCVDAPPLQEQEKHLLKCLLDGLDLAWIKKEGLILSVLVDGINDKLYYAFGDSVIDDNSTLVADYVDDLRELLK